MPCAWGDDLHPQHRSQRERGVSRIDRPIDLLRVDVVNGEFELLRGAERTLTADRPIVAVTLRPAAARTRCVSGTGLLARRSRLWHVSGFPARRDRSVSLRLRRGPDIKRRGSDGLPAAASARAPRDATGLPGTDPTHHNGRLNSNHRGPHAQTSPGRRRRPVRIGVDDRSPQSPAGHAREPGRAATITVEALAQVFPARRTTGPVRPRPQSRGHR